MRESLGKVITCVEPLLMTNLGISHLVQNWLASRGTQKWLRTSGGCCCPANQMMRGDDIFQSRGRTFILAGSLESFCGGLEGSFHLRGNLPAVGPQTRPGWEGEVTYSGPHASLLYHLCPSLLPKLLSYHPLNDTIVLMPIISPSRRM